MRNHNWLRSLTPAFALPLLLAAGCGDDATLITVKGKTLTVKEQSYGMSGTPAVPMNFCQPLYKDQFQVFLSDFEVCSAAKNKASNLTAFHSRETTSLRMIFPSFFMKNPNGTFKTNEFKVLATGDCSRNGGGSAAAFFAHNPAGAGVYDVYEEATSGTVSVTDFSSEMANIKGTYDLSFAGGDRITGSFDAFPCASIPGDYGKK